MKVDAGSRVPELKLWEGIRTRGSEVRLLETSSKLVELALVYPGANNRLSPSPLVGQKTTLAASEAVTR